MEISLDAPTWSGDLGDFEIDVRQPPSLDVPALLLNLISSTPNSLIDNTTWEFYVELGFNTTSGNQLFVYLVSDQEI